MAGVSEDCGIVELCATSYSTACWVPGGIFIRRWCSVVRKILRYLKGVSFIHTAALGLMLGLRVCPEMSVTDYRHTPSNIPEEPSPQLHRNTSLWVLPILYRLYIKQHKIKTHTWKWHQSTSKTIIIILSIHIYIYIYPFLWRHFRRHRNLTVCKQH